MYIVVVDKEHHLFSLLKLGLHVPLKTVKPINELKGQHTLCSVVKQR